MSAEQTTGAFAAATERERAALDAYYVAKERRDEARRALDSRSCGEKFRHAAPGSGAESDESNRWSVEIECTLPRGHAGEHRPDFDTSDTADPAYAQAVQHFHETDRHAYAEREAWEDAMDALDALRCCWLPAGDWPCVLPRGHAGEHAHPTVLDVM